MQPEVPDPGGNPGLLADSINENIDKLRLLVNIIVKDCDLGL